MPEAQIAGSHYEADGTGDGTKRLVNYYAESNPQDYARPVRLATTPGSRVIDGGTTLGAAPRGLFQSDGFAGGKLVIPDGTTVRLMDTSAETFSSLTGALAGTDRVQCVFGQTQAGFLANGALYQSGGSAVAALTDGDWATLLSDHSQSAFTSIATIGQRLVASYGSRFAFSASLDFDTTTTLSWYTAETSPDDIVALAVTSSLLVVFGTQTIELWRQTGDNDDPFNPIVGHDIDRGCMARDSIHTLDNSLFFLSDDRRLMRLNGIQPVDLIGENVWVTRLLEGVDASDVICSVMETEGHSFYFINAPTFCIAYDVATETFHLRLTKDETTWEWAHHVSVGSTHYAASRLAAKLNELDRAFYSDDMADANTYGTAIERVFTAHLSTRGGRRPISFVRLESTKGIGLASGQGSSPLVTMSISKDKGLTYGTGRTRSPGAQGEYEARMKWNRCGRAAPEQTVFKFEVSDPINLIPTSVVVNEQ